MSNIVAMSQTNIPALAMDEQELIQVLQTSLYPGAALSSIKMVLGYCRAAGLDPMQKPVHIVPMWDKNSKTMRDVIMPGVGLYRTNAARTNELAGVSEPEFGPMVNVAGIQVPEWCRVTVKRITQGAERSFSALEYWAENYATAGKDSDQPNAMWRKRPRGQLAKCAQAQALRMAFPEAVGNQPTADEMEGKEIDMGEAVSATQKAIAAPAQLPTYSIDSMNDNLPKWREMIQSGKKSPEQIIAMVASRYSLSAEQRAEITRLADVIDTPISDNSDFINAMESAEQE